MSGIILHHYPESPFSEKIRCLLGYKNASYDAVTIPVIMPKPDLMSLTGGYRKTPVLQIGADIYCDTAIICKVIDRLYPENSIYPVESQAMLVAVANWTDTFFFRVCVTEAFQPKALANSPLFSDQEAAAAFMADRAQLSEGSTQLQMEFEIAHPYFIGQLKRLDNQLSHSDFLFGASPTIADFSTYHCLWFIEQNDAISDVFSPFAAVLQWLSRMKAFGQGKLTELASSKALDIASSIEPERHSKVTTTEMDGLVSGDTVEIMPIDYGFQPVRGELQLASLEELVIARSDERAGDVAVHFPRLGFRVKKV
jgi:glutathione S-transferase